MNVEKMIKQLKTSEMEVTHLKNV